MLSKITNIIPACPACRQADGRQATFTKMRNYVLKFNIVLTLISIGLFGVFNIASAQDNLEVEFENEPLFEVENFVPGESVTGKVTVTNNYDEEKGVGISGEETEESALADVLFLKIEDVDTNEILYGENKEKSLSDFFDDSPEGIHLSNLGAGATQKYNLTVTFGGPEAQNEHQDSTTTFDFTVGFFPKETVSEEEENDTDGGTSGGTTPVGEETEISFTNISDELDAEDESKGNITFHTIENGYSLDTYGAVIYGTSSVEELRDPPRYGYQFREDDDNDDKMATHTIGLTELESGTYYYRVVAWASPTTTSAEYSFYVPEPEEIEEETIEEEEAEEGPTIEGEGVTTPGPGPIAQAEPEGEETAGETTEPAEEEPEEEAEEPSEDEEPDNLLANLQAALGGIFGQCVECLPWWLLLVFAIVPAWLGYREKEEAKSKTWYALAGLKVLVAFVLYFTGVLCVRIAIFAAIGLLELLIWYGLREDTHRRNMLMIAGLLTILILVTIRALVGCIESWLLILLLALYLALANTLHRKLE